MHKALHTPVCDILNIQVPIIQAPIGSATCPRLAAAVSNAGGLGMLSVTWRDLAQTRAVIRETAALTSRPFGVNLVLAWPQAERLRVCLDEGVRIISFFWGDPTPLIPLVHAVGGVVLHTVGSAHEAREAVQAGVNILVAQGMEAGGHVWSKVSTLALVPRVVDISEGVPVVAAGGIADGRGIAAALMLGAAGVWLGTRFVASAEAAAHDVYKRAILAAVETDTVYTTLFDVGWPAAPHRVIRNRTVALWEKAGQPPSGKRPGEGEAVAFSPQGRPIVRYSDVIPLPGMTGEMEALAQYAGQSCGLVHDVKPAGQIVRDLVAETEHVLRLHGSKA